MRSPSWLALATALLMFAQVAETLYSPALVSLAEGFAVDAADASLTLSLYFVAFAAGVLTWGRLCDRWGRRPALLTGLVLYTCAALAALLAISFAQLLLARIVAAFAAAAGSVVTQTALRDRHDGAELARVFSLIGACLALSPALGLITGAWLDRLSGYHGVLAGQLLMALLLLAWTWRGLPETRPTSLFTPTMANVLRRLLSDRHVLRASALVAVFNISVFSWYSLAPFVFERLGASQWMGYSGAALAFGSVLGARLNGRLLRRGINAGRLLRLACLLDLLAALAVLGLGDSLWTVVPMTLVLCAFAMAIPLVLGSALAAYGDCRGSAGALFGLFYYLQIGAGMLLAGACQALGATLFACAVAAWALAIGYEQPGRPLLHSRG
ncbi:MULTISPECIES: Bcr/CflA family efflux MFS transporter [unclassified Pseudomonas]|uniref:Bcr/CflA family efflux MFS transporter n=1 Tax=unclassified Pseudomonas TaxID=196821 RepID=UPI00244D10EA|nr:MULTISPECIES: Bcr/CflA family efflux MFS transporter [unclassified Pseudomonas]MDH0303680.1 Bcr/CflA family efflux MFS transporter [Pseudomonas sp. GD04091]MDH1986702.1 Bcr/CflA family efflux MFS transporter [Pseudomonas sp. GD03689]